jgi:hypothetical protein
MSWGTQTPSRGPHWLFCPDVLVHKFRDHLILWMSFSSSYLIRWSLISLILAPPRCETFSDLADSSKARSTCSSAKAAHSINLCRLACFPAIAVFTAARYWGIRNGAGWTYPTMLQGNDNSLRPHRKIHAFHNPSLIQKLDPSPAICDHCGLVR